MTPSMLNVKCKMPIAFKEGAFTRLNFQRKFGG